MSMSDAQIFCYTSHITHTHTPWESRAHTVELDRFVYTSDSPSACTSVRLFMSAFKLKPCARSIFFPSTCHWRFSVRLMANILINCGTSYEIRWFSFHFLCLVYDSYRTKFAHTLTSCTAARKPGETYQRCDQITNKPKKKKKKKKKLERIWDARAEKKKNALNSSNISTMRNTVKSTIW